MHEGPFAVGLFDLILSSVLANPQHSVVIFPLALLQLQLCRLQQVFVIYTNKQKIHASVPSLDSIAYLVKENQNLPEVFSVW